jgi:hypothetical protein
VAEVSRTTVFSERHVSRGTTNIAYASAPAKSPGFTCIYFQVGGLLSDPHVKLPLPDGRVAAKASQVFLAGDTVRISAPATASHGQKVRITVTGTASISQELYVFAPYGSCAGTAQNEFRADNQFFAKAVARGTFNVPIDVTVPTNAPATLNVCAYVQTGAPSGGAPTGATTAVARAAISIS